MSTLVTATATRPAATATRPPTQTGTSAATDTGPAYPLPASWRGDPMVSLDDLEEVAPPLEVLDAVGDFRITYIPADVGDVLRILPDPTTIPTVGGRLRLAWRLSAESNNPPFPAGQVAILSLTARAYAPGATTRAYIADNAGSSSTLLEAISWTDYQVTRRIDSDAEEVELGLDWANVPADGWLELRAVEARFVPADTAPAELSPTDTPAPADRAAAATAAPLVLPTPTPTLGALPTPTPIATPTPGLIIVTSTPTPVDVFEEATRVANATEWAVILGPATPTPPNLATPTDTPTPIIIVNTPMPANEATATYEALYATAVAATTGTPTPFPPGAVVLVATDTPIPPTPEPPPTPAPTPFFIYLDEIPQPTPTATHPAPPELMGKIVFLSNWSKNPWGIPDYMFMDPDGTNVAYLYSAEFYNRAKARESYSATKQYYAYSLPEAGGEAHNAGLTQIFYDDLVYGSRHQLTYFGAGVAWAPAWSPTQDVVAMVSSESGNDEIWLVERGTWPGVQLTRNDWEWDHHPSFSPDGTKLVFGSNRVTGRRQIWIIDLSGGGEAYQLTNFPFEAWDPVWVKYPDM